MDSFAVQLEDGNWNEGNQEDYGGQPMIGVVVVKDLCFMVVTVAYVVLHVSETMIMLWLM